MERTDRQMAYVFKALGDENRIQILKLLHNGEKCACKLLDSLLPANLSVYCAVSAAMYSTLCTYLLEVQLFLSDFAIRPECVFFAIK